MNDASGAGPDLEALARSAHLTPGQLRDRAVLTIRCQDCRGVPVAYVVYMAGQPVIWARPQRERTRLWGAHQVGALPETIGAWCREREFQVILSASDLPGQGATGKSVVKRVDHQS